MRIGKLFEYEEEELKREKLEETLNRRKGLSLLGHLLGCINDLLTLFIQARSNFQLTPVPGRICPLRHQFLQLNALRNAVT